MEEGKTDSTTLQLTAFILSWSHLCDPVTFYHRLNQDARVEDSHRLKRVRGATER